MLVVAPRMARNTSPSPRLMIFARALTLRPSGPAPPPPARRAPCLPIKDKLIAREIKAGQVLLDRRRGPADHPLWIAGRRRREGRRVAPAAEARLRLARGCRPAGFGGRTLSRGG